MEIIHDCECWDTEDNHNRASLSAQCSSHATMLLYRIDMEDRSGVWFCGLCGNDALKSGLFDAERADER